MTSQQAALVAHVPRTTSDRWFRHFREEIYRTGRKAPRLLGDIEIDQAFFGGKNKKRIRSMLKKIEKLPHVEFERLKKIITSQGRIQVLGILQRGGVVYTQVIRKADARTLTPIVRLVVEKKSTIYTDQWRGFAELSLDGYKHDTVNHSVAYISKTGGNINGIESFWSFAKRRLAKFNGVRSSTFLLHLKECEFRYNHGDNFEKALKSLVAKSVPRIDHTQKDRAGDKRRTAWSLR